VAGDRRATRLRLTPGGRKRFSAVAAVHETWIVELMGTLERTEQRELQRLLGKLKQNAPAGIAARTPRSPRHAAPATTRAAHR
jgi:hypothetical protein